MAAAQVALETKGCIVKKRKFMAAAQVLHAMGFSSNSWQAQWSDPTKSFFLNEDGSDFLDIDGAPSPNRPLSLF